MQLDGVGEDLGALFELTMQTKLMGELKILRDAALRIGAKVCFAARRYDIIIRPLGDVVVLMPAPGMDVDTLDRLLSGTVRTINEYFAQKI